MAVITISRQYAGGGSEIARRVAEQLGWTLIDNEFVDRVAERVGLPPEEVEAREERVPGLIERLARTLATSSPEVFVPSGDIQDAEQDRLVRVTERIITETVQHGDVVMVGRGAQAYLGERDQTMHVYIVAPRETRIATAVERLGQSPDEAARCMDSVDEQRRRYVRTHYRRHWDDAANYHLVLNSAAFGYEGCAALVVEAARRMGLGQPP